MSRNDLVVPVVLVTAVSEVAEAGGVAPTARRMMTPAKSASVGFCHDNATEVLVTLTADRPVTGAGGVVSRGVGPGGVVPAVLTVTDRTGDVTAAAVRLARTATRNAHVPVAVGRYTARKAPVAVLTPVLTVTNDAVPG